MYLLLTILLLISSPAWGFSVNLSTDHDVLIQNNAINSTFSSRTLAEQFAFLPKFQDNTTFTLSVTNVLTSSISYEVFIIVDDVQSFSTPPTLTPASGSINAVANAVQQSLNMYAKCSSFSEDLEVILFV